MGQYRAALASIAGRCSATSLVLVTFSYGSGANESSRIPDGQIETLSGDELLKLEARLSPHMSENSDYARLLRWRLLPPEKRPVDPDDRITQEQAADMIIQPEEDQLRADFLRRYSLDWLPNDPKPRRRAAEFLRKQGKEDLARSRHLIVKRVNNRKALVGRPVGFFDEPGPVQW